MNWKRRWSEMLLAGGAIGIGMGHGGCSRDGDPAIGCCNANGDPCCEVELCGAPMTPQCQAEKSCETAGGEWSFSQCVYEGGADASPAPPPPFGCCNANGDPCCEYLYCGGALTPQCQAELACLDAGYFDPNTGQCVVLSGGDAADAGDTPHDGSPDALEDASDGDAGD